ncbi:hypothetical protein [Spirillospora sp. NPDC047279]|uniref:hypothetical protein n=1 Tax=Spirillospora sp. NPDC047279 TaxID=3155478 RepID=UPI0033CF8A51
MLGTSALGAIRFHAEGHMLDRTRTLHRRFTKLGLDADDARDWFAVGGYHRKADLLLHRGTGRIAGLEPAPSNRLRPLHDDPLRFLDEYGLGERHPELVFNPRSRLQRTAVRQWLDHLRACRVLPWE